MDTHPSDSSATHRLLERARGGDAEAFERLFARHRRFLCQMVQWRMDRNLRRRIDASDLVQEAQMEATRRLEQYLAGPPMSFKIWLRQITYDRLLMARRRHLGAGKRAVEREMTLADETSLQLAQRLLATGPTPSQAAVQDELAARVREALPQLAESDREVLVMRHLEGLANREIAEALGLEPAAASKRHGRALLRLRAMLTDGPQASGCS